MTKVKSALDAEGDGTTMEVDDGNAYVEYTVVVRATDPAGIPGVSTAVTDNSAVVTVVIRVTDVNDAPVVAPGSTATPTFAELARRHSCCAGDLRCDRRGRRR